MVYLRRENVIPCLPALVTPVSQALVRLVPFMLNPLSETTADPSLGKQILNCFTAMFSSLFRFEFLFSVLAPLYLFTRLVIIFMTNQLCDGRMILLDFLCPVLLV